MKKGPAKLSQVFLLVREMRLELTRISPYAPQTYAFTISPSPRRSVLYAPFHGMATKNKKNASHLLYQLIHSKMHNPMTSPSDPKSSDDIINYIEKESYYIPSEFPIKVTLRSKNDLDGAHNEKACRVGKP